MEGLLIFGLALAGFLVLMRMGKDTGALPQVDWQSQ